MENIGLTYHYYIVRKLDGYIWQYISSNVGNWSIDNDDDYSIELDTEYEIGHLYHTRKTNTFFKRIWNEYDDNGIPIESSGYVDTPWIPEK